MGSGLPCCSACTRLRWDSLHQPAGVWVIQGETKAGMVPSCAFSGHVQLAGTSTSSIVLIVAPSGLTVSVNTQHCWALSICHKVCLQVQETMETMLDAQRRQGFLSQPPVSALGNPIVGSLSSQGGLLPPPLLAQQSGNRLNPSLMGFAEHALGMHGGPRLGGADPGLNQHLLTPQASGGSHLLSPQLSGQQSLAQLSLGAGDWAGLQQQLSGGSASGMILTLSEAPA